MSESAGSKMLAVDVHGHCVPRGFLNEVVRTRSVGVHAELVDGKYIVTFPGHEPLRPIAGVMLDTPARAEWLGFQGIGHQVVAPWLDVQGQELPTGVGSAWVRRLNNAMSDVVAHRSQKLTAHATLHLADPAVAAGELTRAVTELGMRSVMIPTSLPAGRLADARYDELWATAVQLNVPVLLHPSTKSPASELFERYSALNGLFGRHVDTTLVAAELIVTGVLDRFPDLRLLIPHGGGFLPYQAARFDRDAQRPTSQSRRPSQIVRSLYYDTTAMSAPSLRFLYEYVGAERVLLGSDFGATRGGHPDVQVTAAVRQAGTDPEVTDAVLAGNARLLFGLSST